MPNFGKANALREELTPMLVFVAFFSCMGAFTFGFDNGWWGGVMGHSYFNQVFGTLETTSATGVVTKSLTASQQSAGTALGTAGIAIGCMVAGQICDWIGRKRSFYVTAIGSILGVLIQITSGINGGRYWQLVAGKIVVCISIGVASVSVPLYLAETSPAAIRGALVNSYVWIQSCGTIAATGVIYAVLNDQSQKVWCLPIGLQMLAPIITLVFAGMLPESPRYLIEKGRTEEARASLVKIRRGKVGFDPDEEIAQLQSVYLQESGKQAVSWIQCFKGTDLRRTLIPLGVQCLQQGQGLSFMANYLVLFFIQLGIANPYKILMIIYGFIVPCTAAGFFVQDYFGRRFLLVGGGAIMGASLLGVAGITTANPSPVGSQANACIALITLWLVAFTQSWTNIPWTVSSEIPSDLLRNKTLAISAIGGYVVGLIVSLVNPYMQDAQYGDLGGKVGFIYGAISGCAVLFCYFFVPELKGRSLEEVDWMWDHKVAIRQMGRYTIPEDALLTISPELEQKQDNDRAGSPTQDMEKAAFEHV